MTVLRAIRRGELKSLWDGKTACVDCGKPAIYYDHRDYGEPLDVEPVCASCNSNRGPALYIDYAKQMREAKRNGDKK